MIKNPGRYSVSDWPPHPMDREQRDHAVCAGCGHSFKVEPRPSACRCGATSAWLGNHGHAVGGGVILRGWEVPDLADPELAVVGCLAVIPALAAARRAGAPISALISWETPGVTPDGLSPRFARGQGPRHLVLPADDITDPGRPLAPRQHHVKAAIRFARVFEARRILVNCHMGISRSTATALAILADRLGAGREEEAVERVCRIRSVSTPNRLIVALADEFLERDGALVEAVARHPDVARRRAGLWP